MPISQPAVTTPLPHGSHSLPPALRLFLFGSIFLFFCSWISEWIATRMLHLPPYPYGLPTFAPEDDFVDITMFWERFHYLHTAAFFDTNARFGSRYLYPAPATLIYKPYYSLFGPHPDALLWFIPLFLLLLSGIFFVALRKRGLAFGPALMLIAVSCICSWPFFFEWNRANIEIFLFAACALGLAALLGQRPHLAAILFGAAGALKLYPVLLLGLLINRRHWKAIPLGLLSIFSVTLLSLWFVGPTIRVAASGIASGLRAFSDLYTNSRRDLEIGLDHSLVALFKAIPRVLPSRSVINHDVHLYILIAGLVGTVLFFTYIRHLPFLNQLLCLAVACVFLPPTSYDYTLLMLYLPWSLLVLSILDHHRHNRPPVPGMLVIVICFTILFGYEPELIHSGIRFGSQLKAVTLAVLLAASLVIRLPSVYDRVNTADV